MNAQNTKLVQNSFKQILPCSDSVVRTFYGYLFTIDPDMRSLFEGEGIESADIFMWILRSAVNGLSELDALVPMLRNLGTQYGRFCVQDEHVVSVGTALICTLDKCLGADFTQDVRDAWMEAYCLIADVVQFSALEIQSAERHCAEVIEMHS